MPSGQLQWNVLLFRESDVACDPDAHRVRFADYPAADRQLRVHPIPGTGNEYVADAVGAAFGMTRGNQHGQDPFDLLCARPAPLVSSRTVKESSTRIIQAMRHSFLVRQNSGIT